MAERVQADLELMLGELEQMQRVGLLSPEETKLVIKKRKRFEYKLQKQVRILLDLTLLPFSEVSKYVFFLMLQNHMSLYDIRGYS